MYKLIKIENNKGKYNNGIVILPQNFGCSKFCYVDFHIKWPYTAIYDFDSCLLHIFKRDQNNFRELNPNIELKEIGAIELCCFME